MSDLETQLRELVAEHLGYCDNLGAIVSDASFADDLGADSIDTIELTMAVEERFGIELSDDEAVDAIGHEGTFGKLCDLVGGKLLAQAEG